ncbi:MAG: phosphotransferase [Pseudomonadota bacterium]
MNDRAELRNKFISHTPWSGAVLDAFDQDASFRRYFRLHGGPSPALLMDAPPPRESLQPFIGIADHLRAIGFSTPRVFVADHQAGLAVIEDFGDDTFTRLLAAGHDERDLYRLATDCLIELHNHPESTNFELPRRAESFLQEVELFCQWFYPFSTGRECGVKIREEFVNAWRDVLAKRPRSRDVIVLRDFHIDNAMLLDDREGVKKCGLLDFQDAAIGPAAYDVMSLLEDARRDVDDNTAGECLKLYRSHSDVCTDVRDFETDCAIVAAQRHTRVAGVFARLHLRDNKPHYLEHLPRVTRLLRKHLSHPALCEFSNWIDSHLPDFDRSAIFREITCA